jgi:xanthine dehydrogenase accessory factor
MQSAEFYRRLLELLQQGEGFAVAYLVRSVGSAPREAGAKMIVFLDGHTEFTIGGGMIEARVIEEAQLIAGVPRAIVREYSLAKLGMHCGGTMRFFCEGFASDAAAKSLPFYRELLSHLSHDEPFAIRYTFDPLVPRQLQKELLTGETELERVTRSGRRASWLSRDDGTEIYTELLNRTPKLLIFGAGHVGRALGELAAASGAFSVEIADDRPEYANRERLPFAAIVHLVAKDYLDALPQPDPWTYVAVITRCHQTDQEILRQLLRREPDWPYTGMIGSRAKRLKLFRELATEGTPTERLARVRSPMGLPLGGKEPGEIAVSILAELIEVKNNQESHLLEAAHVGAITNRLNSRARSASPPVLAER